MAVPSETSRCPVPALCRPAEGTGAGAADAPGSQEPRSRRLLTYRIGGLVPPPAPGGGTPAESGSQSGAGGWGRPLRRADTSLSVTYTRTEKIRAGKPSCRLLSCLRPPAGAQDWPLPSLVRAGSAGASGTLLPAPGQSASATDQPPPPSYPLAALRTPGGEGGEGCQRPCPGCRGRRTRAVARGTRRKV